MAWPGLLTFVWVPLAGDIPAILVIGHMHAYINLESNIPKINQAGTGLCVCVTLRPVELADQYVCRLQVLMWHWDVSANMAS